MMWKGLSDKGGIPHITTAERNALTPHSGLKIYNTSLNKTQSYENGFWYNILPDKTSVASDTLRNSNDDTRTTTSITSVKLKEIRLNADLQACRIKFDMHGDLSGIGTAYGHIWKNGNIIGTLQSTASTTFVTFSEDFTNFLSGDLIQLYARNNGGYFGLITSVCNLRLYYTSQITAILGETLDTPLPVSAISVTNQDP